jgi:hypothetical protein
MRLNRLSILGLTATAIALLSTAGLQARPAVAQAPFAMGAATVVDPIRGVGEPDIAVLSTNSPFISGPGGSSTQTSFFWNSRDGGQTFMLRGPHNGHWICPALGGGDSLNVVDRKTNDMYVIDQESLLDLGMGKIDGSTGAVNAKCLNAPGVTADRPFLAVANGANAPQVAADGGKAITYLSWQCRAGPHRRPERGHTRLRHRLRLDRRRRHLPRGGAGCGDHRHAGRPDHQQPSGVERHLRLQLAWQHGRRPGHR